MRIAIEGDLTVRRASELKTMLLAPLQLQHKAKVEIELSQVTSLDCAGVQLLLLAKRTAAANDVELQLVGHSPAAIEVFQLLGLAATLDVPAAAGAQT